MKLSVKPGKYVVAVSGGVDSMVLLDILRRDPQLELVVAHFEHGIRSDSDKDRQLVQAAANRYGLPFFFEHGALGSQTSEAEARAARYRFLQSVKQQTGAGAIITAHHQDDVLETAIINILRGTGRKGLSSLTSTTDIVRPLLDITKRDIYQQARQIMHQDAQFTWNEDSTNASDQYLRNYIRRHVIKGLGEQGRQQLLRYAQQASEHNPIIDTLLLSAMDNQHRPAFLRRRWLSMLPYDLSCEVMAAWLRQNGLRQFDRKLIERLVVFAKVAVPGKQADIMAGFLLKTSKAELQILRVAPSSKQLNSV